MVELSPELLSGVPALLAIARHGSATKAARALGTTPTTVLRHLEAMEVALGARLFDRLPSGLVPTPALELVLPWAEQAAAATMAMSREVGQLEARPSGLVRLAAPPVFAGHFLVPALGALIDAYPELRLELASAQAVVDLAQREADLAVRVVRPTQGDLVLKELYRFGLVVVAAPALLRGRSPLKLTELPWATWPEPLGHIPEAAWLRAHVPEPKVVLRSSNLSDLLRAAQVGLAATVVAEPIAAAAGGLVKVPVRGVERTGGSLWLVAHRALRSVPRVAAVWDWALGLFEGRAQRERLELEVWRP